MDNRINKILKNVIFGAGSELILTIFPFISRSVFIKTLGVDYLGVSGLFTSILSVLSMAELGIGNIVIYSLYKPVAEGDRERVKSLLSFYKKVYFIICCAIMVLGLMIIPALPYIINLPEHMDHIILYYILYLINSCASYLCVYKQSVILADQKQYIITSYHTIGMILMYVLQIVALLLFKSFLLYLILLVATTVATNLYLSYVADKKYPYIKEHSVEIEKTEKKKILSDTFSMMKYKVGGVFINSTDNMFISKFVGTQMVGYYNNYYIIENAINKVINVIYNGIYTSVGNLNAVETTEKKKQAFDSLLLLFVCIATFSVVGFYMIVDDFVTLWLGAQYCIDRAAVFAISVKFYLPIVLYPVWMYRNTTGLFNETRNILLYAAALNLIFSFVFGLKWGLVGILLATSVARLLTSFWYEPYILYKKVFENGRVWEYAIILCKSIAVIVFSCWLCNIIFPQQICTIGYIFAKFMYCLIVPTVLFLILNFNSSLKHLLLIAKNKIGRK